MAARKKTVKPKSEPVVVTQVVEEVSDVDTKPLEDIKQDAADIEQKVQELEENIETATESVPVESAKEEEKKELVDELFQKETKEVAPEIAMYKGVGGGKSVFIWALIVIVIALLTGGGLFLAVRGKSSLPFLAQPTPTPTPAPLPTPTPAELSRESLNVQVLNGGGVAGAGSKMKKFLEDKGYKVGDVGNADAYTYENTQVLVKPDKEAFLSLFENDLKNSYTVGTAAATLSSDSSFDAQVIVGKE